MGVINRTRFCDRAAESMDQMHFLLFLREDWGTLKNLFLQNLHRDITFRTQCDRESV